MTLRHWQPGQRWKPASAADQNAIVDAAENYQRRGRLGVPQPARQVSISTDCIKVKNNSGAARAKGEVLEIATLAVTASTPDPAHLWFFGATPTVPVNSFCVLRQPLASSEYGDGQISGVCVARVNITDTNHLYAAPNASHVLQSGDEGPALIIAKASVGTGEKDCVINLSNPPPPPPLRYITTRCSGITTVNSGSDVPMWIDSPYSSGPSEYRSDSNGSHFDFTGTVASPSTDIEVLWEGMYWCSLQLQIESTTAVDGQAIELSLYRNGAISVPPAKATRDQHVKPAFWSTEHIGFSQPVYFAANDIATIRNSGATSISVEADFAFCMWFMGENTF